MILVPLPKDASRGDQLENAKYFENQGYSKTILQENLTTKTLLQEISNIQLNRQKYLEKMEKSSQTTNGTQNIYQEIKKFL